MRTSLPNIVVIGGGTGSFTLLSQLKDYAANITVLVNMADDGGSTGLLRDELGVLPPGDVRQCLVALSKAPQMRELFNYRFDEGSLAGHSFGNLFLTAVEKMTDNFSDAVDLASKVLNVTGHVIPLTLDKVTLVMEKSDGSIHRGQQQIAQRNFGVHLRPQFRLEPKARITSRAKQAIADADLIVISPGHLYGTLAPALVVEGVAAALAASAAKKAYVCNLVTKPGQTDGFTVTDFASEIERFLDNKVTLDFVLYNNAKPDKKLLSKYAQEGEYWVTFDVDELKKQHYQSIGDHFVSDTPYQSTAKKDLLVRTLIRHDADKVAKALMELVT